MSKIAKTKIASLVIMLFASFLVTTFPMVYAAPHTEITVATAWGVITNGTYPNLVILDVRNQSEYDAGYISRATLIPLWQLQQRIGELAPYKNSEIIVYCKSGDRSQNASLILDANSFTKVYDMNGGIDAWNSSRYPIVKPIPAGSGAWTLTTDSRALKAYPDLKEYIWQKNATMPPNGPYDKIGLHRLMKSGVTSKGVVFMLPGIYATGDDVVSDPANFSFAKTENMSQGIYWANRGFDVYTIDYRSHFIPVNFNKSQLLFTADWGMDQWISDIKEAVDKAKEVSGARKIFIGGMSWGGILAQIYAAKYWQQDLRGLVLLDPGPMKSTVTKNQNITNSYNLTFLVNAVKFIGAYIYENPETTSAKSPFNPGYVFLLQFAAQNPGDPAQYLNGTLITTINPRTNKIWANITEYFEYTWNTAYRFNTYGGYSDISTDLILSTQADRYYPVKLFLDYLCMLDYTVCPYFPYDYTAHINEIDVPVIACRSGLNLAAYGNIIDGMVTTDFTWSVLPNYGHVDVFQGTYSARDVSQPTLDWMLRHYQAPAATAFCDVTVMAGWTWNFFAHSNGGIGAHTYQWFEGSTQLQGQTSMVLPVTKSAPGTYTFYCKVTDSEGTTTNSNTVTLTVTR